MKKTTNSNPLKTFNDAFDKRKAGMVKSLVKAQAGYTNLQGPISKEAANELSIISSPTIDEMDYKTDKIVSRPRTMPEMVRAQHRVKTLMDAQRNPALQEGSNEYDKAAYRKTGGQTKSKKK
jgi:hypothetical protein